MKSLFAKIAAFIANVSPKVKSGLNWGTLAGLVVEIASLVTPQMLSWSGPFEPLLFALIPLAAGQVAAWIKGDPLRAEGAKSIAEKAAKAALDAAAASLAAATPATAPAAVVTPEPVAAPAPAVTVPASTPAVTDEAVTISK